MIGPTPEITPPERRDDPALPTFLFGVVESVNGSVPGPASGLTYNVALNGSGKVLRFSNVVPANARYPDIVNVFPAPPGSGVLAQRSGDTWVFYLLAGELLQLQECP